MHKPLQTWDNDFISSLEATERTDFEIKGSGALENLRNKVGNTVSALANYDGGHIILGAKESQGKIEADGLLKTKADRLLKVSVLPTPPTISSGILLKWADDGTRRS
jgi:predicted HTH transcriptional regulator